MSFETELAAVAAWCDRTDAIALEHFGTSIAQQKADGTDVTIADRSIEQTLRAAITTLFPGDAIFGEEEGLIGEGPRRWIIDPIDATTNYVRGIPIFATLVALEDDEGLALGFVSAPGLQTRWWATRGGGAFSNNRPIHVSVVDKVEAMHLSTGDVALFGRQQRLGGLTTLLERVARHRGFGDFYGHMLVAQGSVDAMADPIVSPWDLAAVQIIVEEAGGLATTLGGERRYDGGSFLTSNGLLHGALLEAFSI